MARAGSVVQLRSLCGFVQFRLCSRLRQLLCCVGYVCGGRPTVALCGVFLLALISRDVRVVPTSRLVYVRCGSVVSAVSVDLLWLLVMSRMFGRVGCYVRYVPVICRAVLFQR